MLEAGNKKLPSYGQLNTHSGSFPLLMSESQRFGSFESLELFTKKNCYLGEDKSLVNTSASEQ